MQVQSTWRSTYKVKSSPYRSTVLFDKTNAVVHSLLKKTKISSKRLNAKNVWKFQENPALSIRKLSILKRDLKLKPYKYQEAHLLEATNYDKRVIFALFLSPLVPISECGLKKDP